MGCISAKGSKQEITKQLVKQQSSHVKKESASSPCEIQTLSFHKFYQLFKHDFSRRQRGLSSSLKVLELSQQKPFFSGNDLVLQQILNNNATLKQNLDYWLKHKHFILIGKQQTHSSFNQTNLLKPYSNKIFYLKQSILLQLSMFQVERRTDSKQLPNNQLSVMQGWKLPTLLIVHQKLMILLQLERDFNKNPQRNSLFFQDNFKITTFAKDPSSQNIKNILQSNTRVLVLVSSKNKWVSVAASILNAYVLKFSLHSKEIVDKLGQISNSLRGRLSLSTENRIVAKDYQSPHGNSFDLLQEVMATDLSPPLKIVAKNIIRRKKASKEKSTPELKIWELYHTQNQSDKQKTQKAFAITMKVLANIYDNPNSENFRVLKPSNPVINQIYFKSSVGLQILRTMGFKETASKEELYNQESKDYLRMIKQNLQEDFYKFAN